MSKVKVGDKIKIKIIRLDVASQRAFPEFAGTIQTVIKVDEDGDPRFGTQYSSSGGLWVECGAGAEFEVIDEN